MTDDTPTTPARLGGPADLPTDALFAVLSNTVRRTVLFHLRQHGAATYDELVDVVAGVVDDDSPERRAGVTTSLQHVHLPKLAEGGLVVVDADRRVVEAATPSPVVGDLLDLAVRRDLAFEAASDDASDGPIRVLLVDDEPGLPETIAGYVEREYDDVRVTVAVDVLQAITTLRERPFDCVVSDYQMPAVSGIDFLKVVRETDPALPFIIFTAKGSEGVASDAIAAHVTDYVRKRPDTDQYDELVTRIRRAIGDQ